MIVSGKDRGKTGKVIRVFPEEARLVVENVNLRKRHVRARRGGEKGQVATFPAPLALASVMLVCPKCGKATRVGYSVGEERKRRICKKCKSEI